MSKKPESRKQNTVGLVNFVLAARPWSFTASMTMAMLGTTLAWKEQQRFDIFTLILTILTVISVQGAGNLVNTYYDYWNGVDNTTATDHTLVDGRLTSKQMKTCIGAAYVLSLVSFSVLLYVVQSDVVALTLIYVVAVILSFLYTGSVGLKYYALGEVVIFFNHGLLTVVFAYATQTGAVQLNPPAKFFLPLVMTIEAMLHGNNLRDLEEDSQAGISTVAIMLGEKASCVFYTALVYSPYLVVIFMTAFMSWFFLLPMLTLPTAINLVLAVQEKRMKKLPQETAKLNLLFGVLYIISFLCSHAFKSI